MFTNLKILPFQTCPFCHLHHSTSHVWFGPPGIAFLCCRVPALPIGRQTLLKYSQTGSLLWPAAIIDFLFKLENNMINHRLCSQRPLEYYIQKVSFSLLCLPLFSHLYIRKACLDLSIHLPKNLLLIELPGIILQKPLENQCWGHVLVEFNCKTFFKLCMNLQPKQDVPYFQWAQCCGGAYVLRDLLLRDNICFSGKHTLTCWNWIAVSSVSVVQLCIWAVLSVLPL